MPVQEQVISHFPQDWVGIDRVTTEWVSCQKCTLLLCSWWLVHLSLPTVTLGLWRTEAAAMLTLQGICLFCKKKMPCNVWLWKLLPHAHLLSYEWYGFHIPDCVAFLLVIQGNTPWPSHSGKSLWAVEEGEKGLVKESNLIWKWLRPVKHRALQSHF